MRPRCPFVVSIAATFDVGLFARHEVRHGVAFAVLFVGQLILQLRVGLFIQKLRQRVLPAPFRGARNILNALLEPDFTPIRKPSRYCAPVRIPSPTGIVAGDSEKKACS